MKVAVVGAPGLVGSKMLQVLAERNFPVTELIPVASERSVGKEVEFKGKKYNDIASVARGKGVVIVFPYRIHSQSSWARVAYLAVPTLGLMKFALVQAAVRRSILAILVWVAVEKSPSVIDRGVAVAVLAEA